jgi:hypothetical protein
LGNFIFASSALKAARKHFIQVNGCEQCCRSIYQQSR